MINIYMLQRMSNVLSLVLLRIGLSKYTNDRLQVILETSRFYSHVIKEIKQK